MDNPLFLIKNYPQLHVVDIDTISMIYAGNYNTIFVDTRIKECLTHKKCIFLLNTPNKYVYIGNPFNQRATKNQQL